MKLYTYWRSSAAYRVRIGLNLKKIDYSNEYIHLVKDGGQQHSDDYRQVNPTGLVPSLELDDGRILTQSLTILEYIDETYPQASLLSSDPVEKANIRAFAQSIACDIHPINNLRILQYLSNELDISDEEKNTWYRHWVQVGLSAAEKTISETSNGKFCFGDNPTLADICLIPQVYNALRFNLDMSLYPTLASINEHCLSLDAFHAATPEEQGDAI